MLCFTTVATIVAQEAVHMSLAGAEAAEARRKADSTLDYYNLKAGPTAWRFSSSLGAEVNDNIQLEPTSPMTDLIFRPEINARMLWAISDKNNLHLTLGGGYSAYVWHPQFDRFYISPGSELTYDIYVRDFWINIHDRCVLTENSYQDPTVVGSADYSRLENVAGLKALWDLDKSVITLGYDHVNYVSVFESSGPTTGQAPDGRSEVFSASGGYSAWPGVRMGIQLGGSLFHYDNTAMNQSVSDATEWSIGAFVQGQLSEHVSCTASAGYTVYTPRQTGRASGQSEEFSGLYAQLTLRHDLNQYVNYTLSSGRSINFAFYGGTVDMYFARLQANWNIIRKITLSTLFEYEHGSQLAVGAETFDRYGPAIIVGRMLTRKLSANLAYQYYWRGSDLPGRDYVVNIATLNLTYQF